jgi:hypothetical protein
LTQTWMCSQIMQLYLATKCGSPKEVDGQYRALKWCDPPRSPLCREWVSFLSRWHALVYRSSCRLRGWPPAPPTILEFCRRYDLPVPPWAVRNAELHGWEHLSAVADKLNARHRYLVSLTPEARLHLYSVEAQMRRFEQDRDWALMGWTQTAPGCWHWPRLLLRASKPPNRLTAHRVGSSQPVTV